MKLVLIFLSIIYSTVAFSDDVESGGGYDPLAAEKAKIAARNEALLKQSIKDAQEAKIKKANANARRKKQLKLDQERKIEEARKELLPESMAKLNDWQVCFKAGKSNKTENYKNWIDELRRRKTSFNESSIRNGEIKIGGFECDAFATFGIPIKYNRTVNARGTSVQMVYDRTYIYTDNGVITSWSD